eukprot:jgi/Chlat1/188/Chrsp1S03256
MGILSPASLPAVLLLLLLVLQQAAVGLAATTAAPWQPAPADTGVMQLLRVGADDRATVDPEGLKVFQEVVRPFAVVAAAGVPELTTAILNALLQQPNVSTPELQDVWVADMPVTTKVYDQDISVILVQAVMPGISQGSLVDSTRRQAASMAFIHSFASCIVLASQFKSDINSLISDLLQLANPSQAVYASRVWGPRGAQPPLPSVLWVIENATNDMVDAGPEFTFNELVAKGQQWSATFDISEATKALAVQAMFQGIVLMPIASRLSPIAVGGSASDADMGKIRDRVGTLLRPATVQGQQVNGSDFAAYMQRQSIAGGFNATTPVSSTAQPMEVRMSTFVDELCTQFNQQLDELLPKLDTLSRLDFKSRTESIANDTQHKLSERATFWGYKLAGTEAEARLRHVIEQRIAALTAEFQNKGRAMYEKTEEEQIQRARTEMMDIVNDNPLLSSREFDSKIDDIVLAGEDSLRSAAASAKLDNQQQYVDKSKLYIVALRAQAVQAYRARVEAILKALYEDARRSAESELKALNVEIVSLEDATTQASDIVNSFKSQAESADATFESALPQGHAQQVEAMADSLWKNVFGSIAEKAVIKLEDNARQAAESQLNSLDVRQAWDDYRGEAIQVVRDIYSDALQKVVDSLHGALDEAQAGSVGPQHRTQVAYDLDVMSTKRYVAGVYAAFVAEIPAAELPLKQLANNPRADRSVEDFGRLVTQLREKAVAAVANAASYTHLQDYNSVPGVDAALQDAKGPILALEKELVGSYPKTVLRQIALDINDTIDATCAQINAAAGKLVAQLLLPSDFNEAVNQAIDQAHKNVRAMLTRFGMPASDQELRELLQAGTVQLTEKVELRQQQFESARRRVQLVIGAVLAFTCFLFIVGAVVARVSNRQKRPRQTLEYLPLHVDPLSPPKHKSRNRIVKT